MSMSIPLADTRYRDVEAVIKEASFLEAALYQAAEAAQGRHGCGGSAGEAPQTQYEYAVQLRAWVDMQVDSRLQHVMQTFVEGELSAARQEAAAALATCERLQADLAAATATQSKLLSVVSEISDEMAHVKTGIAGCSFGDVQRLTHHEAELERHGRELEELRALRITDEKTVSELRAELQDKACDKRACHFADARNLAEEVEVRLSSWKREITSEVTQGSIDAAMRAVDGRLRLLEEHVDTNLQSMRLKLEKAECTRTDLEMRLERGVRGLKELRETEPPGMNSSIQELKRQTKESQVKLGEELVALQQKSVADLRAEMAAAFRSEAAAVAALDEQIWLTDQRLGQRIDELAHLHLRERVATVERRCKEASSLLSSKPAGEFISTLSPCTESPRKEEVDEICESRKLDFQAAQRRLDEHQVSRNLGLHQRPKEADAQPALRQSDGHQRSRELDVQKVSREADVEPGSRHTSIEDRIASFWQRSSVSGTSVGLAASRELDTANGSSHSTSHLRHSVAGGTGASGMNEALDSSMDTAREPVASAVIGDSLGGGQFGSGLRGPRGPFRSRPSGGSQTGDGVISSSSSSRLMASHVPTRPQGDGSSTASVSDTFGDTGRSAAMLADAFDEGTRSGGKSRVAALSMSRESSRRISV